MLKNIFKKISPKEEQKFPEKVYACAKGEVIPLTEVQDEVFAGEVMGKGYGIIPTSGEIYAPVDGSVEMVFPTKHAIGLKTKSGAEILIHIGINTVELNGKGFECLVQQGSKVKKGQLIERFDMKAIKSEAYDTTVMLIITNTDEYKSVEWMSDSLILEK